MWLRGSCFNLVHLKDHSRDSIERRSDLNYVLKIICIKLDGGGQEWKREVSFKAILLILARDGAWWQMAWREVDRL